MSFYDDVRNFLGDLECQETRTENEKRAYALLASIRPVLNQALDENKVLSSEIALMRLRDDGSEEIACLRKENEELKNQPVSLLARRVDELEKRFDGPRASSAPVSGPEGWKDVLNWVYYTEKR